MPTEAPQPTTAAPKPTTAAPKVMAFNAAAIKCDACLAKFADLPADDAAKICQKLKCQPAAAVQPMAAAAAVAPAMWPAFSNFASAAAGVPFGDCSAAGHLLQVTDVSINPSPPKRGQNVAITVSGNLNANVGAVNARLTIKYGIFTVIDQNFALPGAAAGPVSQTINLVVPGNAPGGTYAAQGVITSGGQQLACVNVNFNL